MLAPLLTPCLGLPGVATIGLPSFRTAAQLWPTVAGGVVRYRCQVARVSLATPRDRLHGRRGVFWCGPSVARAAPRLKPPWSPPLPRKTRRGAGLGLWGVTPRSSPRPGVPARHATRPGLVRCLLTGPLAPVAARGDFFTAPAKTGSVALRAGHPTRRRYSTAASSSQASASAWAKRSAQSGSSSAAAPALEYAVFAGDILLVSGRIEFRQNR